MPTLTARTPAGRTERPAVSSPSTVDLRAMVMRLGIHDIATELPVEIRGIIQKGLLDRVFQDALHPEWIFPAVADVQPWAGGIGDEKIWTRTGLMTPSPTPVSPGSDATADTYTVEQWSSIMSRYGRSIDTDMLASAVALASKYLQDVKTLGTHAGQTMNQAARNALFGAYAGGNTYVTTDTTSSATLPVKDTTGFGFVSVNGKLTAVSVTNPLNVTINGVANTVTATSAASGPGNLTLTTPGAISATHGWAVVASNAPTSIRPTGSSLFDLTSGSIATLALFRSAYTRLKKMNVPTIGGGYTAFVTNDTINELYSDPAFNLALTGQVESPVWRELAIGRINGVDFVPNNEVPTVLGGTHASAGTGTLTVNRTVVVGAGALMWCPLENLGGLLQGTGVEGVPSISMVSPAQGVDVAVITRPPQNRWQDVISTTWQAVGGYGVPTDLQNASGDAALYKRACIVEHS